MQIMAWTSSASRCCTASATRPRRRLRETKQTLRLQTYDDLIDDVADALDSDARRALAQRLREQYAFALVDEFQDTDARQWAIFERLFGAGRSTPVTPGRCS